MFNFLEWVFREETPPWVMILFLIALGSGVTTLSLFSLQMIVVGHYWVPIAIWVVLPLVLVISEFLKSGGKGDER